MSNSFVLVINSGSSSLKFAVIDSVSGDAVLSGLGECFGLSDARMSWKFNGEKKEISIEGDDSHHKIAIGKLVGLTEELGLAQDIVAVGHRIVHGGEKFTKTVRITEEVTQEIEKLADLAPLHNPAGAIGIRAAVEAFPSLPQFAVFDTAFHQTMPQRAFTGAIAKELYTDFGIRRYGFHGTSHYFVSREAAKMINKPIEESSFISVHLGNGASVCAINNGESVDTSMGFTPLSGLMMGTRCGDLDPGIIEYLLKKGWSQEKVFNSLNKASGFLGVSGLTSDARGILEAMEEGHEGAALAFQVFTYRVSKYIASYLAALDSFDGIIFTGGIGENSMPIRREILKNLKLLGFVEDVKGNEDARFGNAGVIATSELLGAKALVIPTNEEWVIAQQSVELL
ncbi:acetate/propionate family kinase [Vibrio parahaemolyticus]|uniref:Acetate kinase 2 n=9 Tax=Vibrio parahaemolyticus TaxID=670 RepID=ACKA2_VIBPA|nr:MULTISPECIES: acetate/propionate family kinase [Vibrio]Q87IJ5.1 RecName: Full=Acetate kinase 2; AltName: Full=Acetokinase 2 [Vibrio parahaemolyticus RIMD 2210633]EFO38896.1 acetate kinase [Vibrio parahaemolyticus Peru-466]EFO44350.1 acetate kinase [Vibrio parahaemolyticus AQ4037]EFO48986.1 acetate kinase [Vibrio parahaemolyticus K5030]EJG0766147.1 acetate/propionate family kinase [Vibrio parahaemolyticus O5:K30]EJG0919334.1 acetate/propionate family kinase [Vibrio parahaemolyticus O1:K68]